MKKGNLDSILKCFKTFLEDNSIGKRIFIKVNLQSIPSEHSPRTDSFLLKEVIDFLLSREHLVTIVEGAGGYLEKNLKNIGLGTYVGNGTIFCIDTDMESDLACFVKSGRRFFVPRVLSEADLRIAIPCASKRRGYLFSCNVKTFVGIVPQKACKNGTDSRFSRPTIHENLTETVSDLYKIINMHFPFSFYINGGNTISDKSDIRELPEFYCSTDPIELDEYVAKVLNVDVPKYLSRLKNIT